ncbi:unnamed protein product [Clonostachys rhizophaga]|uniref:Zinc transporter ZIP9 n=1 Tax=Clonostachys rhizophaga TaxID=160324 RepID=A0A9N9YD52_9HYPO|nr:unnamed protein product [Clonostachys rhizophaga]
MSGLILLLALCAVMAVASFLAGSLPLSMTLSQSQMRFISSIGVGVLVGTSLIIIIPEGIEAATAAAVAKSKVAQTHNVRAVVLSYDLDSEFGPRVHYAGGLPNVGTRENVNEVEVGISPPEIIVPRTVQTRDEHDHGSSEKEHSHDHAEGHVEVPAFEIGLSLVLGFALMFLIERIPKHASERFQQPPQPRHVSLDNLNGEPSPRLDENDSFLGAFSSTGKGSRSLATTLGLVIHAAADGIAMGASSTASDTQLGFIVFVAIMIHKAPASFGLTSVLLKQGLSKRAARAHLMVFSLAAPAGALTTWLLITILGGGNMDGDAGKWWTGMLLLFSGGTFLYVAMHAMNDDGSHDSNTTQNGYSESGSPRQPKGPQMIDTLATVGGMLLPLLAQLGGHHHH